MMGHTLRPHHQTSHAGSGGREDCWSEGATKALIEAWGERFVQLSRGNLRQKDWKEVAEAVNEHLEGVGKPWKTDIQCKNRVDTLKKKYKIEKAKPGPSDWTFYSRMETLVGSNSVSNPTSSAATGIRKPQPPSASAVKSQRHPSITFTVKHRPPADANPNPNPTPTPTPNSNPNPNPNPNPAVHSVASSSRSRMNTSPVSSESSRGESGGVGKDNNDEENEGVVEAVNNGVFGRERVAFGRRRQWGSLVGLGGGNGTVGVEGAFGDLARAIQKFGEIYERVESSKQRQMLELERQRMEFAKELEFQRMQMFMEAQLELEKMKRPKYAPSAGKRL